MEFIFRFSINWNGDKRDFFLTVFWSDVLFYNTHLTKSQQWEHLAKKIKHMCRESWLKIKLIHETHRKIDDDTIILFKSKKNIVKLNKIKKHTPKRLEENKILLFKHKNKSTTNKTETLIKNCLELIFNWSINRRSSDRLTKNYTIAKHTPDHTALERVNFLEHFGEYGASTPFALMHAYKMLCCRRKIRRTAIMPRSRRHCNAVILCRRKYTQPNPPRGGVGFFWGG